MTSGAVDRLAPNDMRRIHTEVKAGASDLCWAWHGFEDLHPRLLYGALRLRQDIFIVEQDVAYADLDGRDLESLHLLGTLAGETVAYLRVLPKGLFKTGAHSFGRVTVRRDLRGVGLGRNLVSRCLERLDETRGAAPIEISSQHYLADFYGSFGFVAYGDSYIEDKIVHVAMRRQ